MRAYIIAFVLTATAAIAEDGRWALRGFERSEFGNCRLDKESPASMFDAFKQAGMHPTIEDRDDKGVNVNFVDGRRGKQLVYYRTMEDCQAAVAAAATAAREKEAEERK